MNLNLTPNKIDYASSPAPEDSRMFEELLEKTSSLEEAAIFISEYDAHEVHVDVPPEFAEELREYLPGVIVHNVNEDTDYG